MTVVTDARPPPVPTTPTPAPLTPALPGTKPCGARKRNGELCRMAAMANGRCRMHGGMSLSGPLLPQYIDGRSNLPPRMRETYLRALRDPEILNLNRDIATLEARIDDLLSKVDSGESGRLWVDLLAAWDDVDQVKYIEDEKEKARAFRSSMAKLGRLVLQGYGDRAAWSEVRECIQERRKLIDSERARRKDMSLMVTAEQFVAFGNAMLESIKRNVTDRAALVAISADFSRLLNVPERR